MAEFRITNEHSPSEVGNVIDVLRRPRIWIPTQVDYPDHQVWLDKTEAQIASGKKRAFLAYNGIEPIGSVVYQRHEQQPDVLEIRSISVVPESNGRYVGSFILRNTEIEGAANDFPGVDTVMVDTKVSNTEMIDFLLKHGYVVVEITDLYQQGAGLDAVLTKTLVV